MRENIDVVITNEICYALSELVKIEKGLRNFDIKTQLVNNSYIFKENLKIIFGFMSTLISRADLEGENEDRLDQRNHRGGPEESEEEPDRADR